LWFAAASPVSDAGRECRDEEEASVRRLGEDAIMEAATSSREK
jgi:hypothetical protein